MLDFFTLLFIVLLLIEAIGGIMLIGWWVQRRGANALAWWSLAHGVGVLVVCIAWYAFGGSVARVSWAEFLLGGILLMGVLPAFSYVVNRLIRAESLLDSTRRKNLWHYVEAADPQDADQLSRDLREAICNPDGQLSLQYQPIFDAATRTVCGFEALLRWNHPERGSLSPAQFIPLAESNGTIQQLGQWVLQKACNDAAGWPHPWYLSVNVSPAQLGSRLVGQVHDALRDSQLAPGRLLLELTEGVMVDSSGATHSRLSALRNLGARIAIDDFGTGYSSLRYLERLPCDVIKIDRSFVNDLSNDQSVRAITGAVIKLCHELNLEVVAEGVETEAQLDTLNELGCERVQGWLLGKSMTHERLIEVFRDNALYEAGRDAENDALVEPSADTGVVLPGVAQPQPWKRSPRDCKTG